MVLLMLLTSLSQMNIHSLQPAEIIDRSSENPWSPDEQPWSQYGGVPTRNGSMPNHSADGGPGIGSVEDITSLASINDPVINWVGLDDGIGSDAYGSIIGNFSANLNTTPGAIERCTPLGLFAVVLHDSTGTSTTKLSLIAGDDASIAWQVDLGSTKSARSTPVLVDVDLDGTTEVIVVYDTDSSFNVDVWSPELTCDESGWQTGGHSNEVLWSWSDADVRIGITSPHAQTRESNHLSVTQPLLADLELDGQPELIVSVVDISSDDPQIMTIPLGSSMPSEPVWEVILDRGTHPSDPAWAQLDASNTAVVATTIDENSGNMWIWRLDGATGSNSWGRVAITGTDPGQTDSPRLRLPSPVVTQLDNDAAPEMILTVPTDSNGRTTGYGARFVGMELTSTQEIFSFRAQNGFADAPPLPIDTDSDGIDDRLCWVTWYSASSISFDREGMVGCHDLSNDPPDQEWSKVMNRGGSGNPNDEIAVSPPSLMDIDGEDGKEIVVAFGRRVFAFEGDTGYTDEVSEGWDEPLATPHRVWSAPAFADMDGDGSLDMLLGDTLISQRVLDLAPLPDSNGISFNPASPDPGQTLTVTGQFANIGTWENEDSIDCVLRMNGDEITRVRIDELQPLSPSGDGGPSTFSVDVTATLGSHLFELVLDINDNLTEAREDNNIEEITLNIVEPYAVLIQSPESVTRVNPGMSQDVEISLLATGSRTASWTVTYDTSNLPQGWNVAPQQGTTLTSIEIAPAASVPLTFVATLPQDALGDEDGYIDITATLDSDPSVNTTVAVPIEALRTRGLSLVGPEGLSSSNGYGIPGNTAEAYVMIENLGNAPETTTSIDWTNPSWGGTPVLNNGVNNVYSITLQPGEKRELAINLDVPLSTSLGTSTVTTLTTCIGSGDDTLCRSLEVNLTAVGSHSSPVHIRTVPSSLQTFEINALIPTSGSLSWDLNTAGVYLQHWQWNTTSNAVINNGVLEITGASGTVVKASMEVYIPTDAPPQRLVFNTAENAALNHHDFMISVHVLQIHRSAISIIDPLSSLEPSGFNVSIPHQLLIQLENPGNGEDTYLLSGSVVPSDEISSDDVDFTFFNPQRTLAPLATTIMPVEITLDSSIPAAQPFEIEFTWASIINESVSASTTLLIQAEQRHSWEIIPLDGQNMQVLPNEEFEFSIQVKNTGNFVDTVQLIPEISIATTVNDTSIWDLHDSVDSLEIEVNASQVLTVEQTIPFAWENTIATITYKIISSGYELGQFNITLEVQKTAKWHVNLANSELEILPGGDTIQVEVVQLGNSPSIPYFTKSGQGWNTSLPDGTLMEPGQSELIDIYVESPESAIAGEVNIVKIRVSDGVGLGLEEFEIPVRVSPSPNFELNTNQTWFVSSDGGYPLAWMENSGNTMSHVPINLENLPTGWTVSGEQSASLSPHEIRGIPFEIIPPSDWDQESFDINIIVDHPDLGLYIGLITVQHSNISFSSSPVLSGSSGSTQSFTLHSNSTIATTVTGATMNQDEYRVVLEEGIRFASVSSSNDIIQYVSIGASIAQVTASCQFISNVFDELGRTPLTSVAVSCSVTGDLNEQTRLTFIASTSTGQTIPLDVNSFTIQKNESGMVNLSVTQWDPAPGPLMIRVVGYDGNGLEVISIETAQVSRESNWNVGIASFSATGDLDIAITRSNYQILGDINCILTVTSSSSSYSIQRIVDVEGSQFAPIVKIKNPGISDKESLSATIGCDSPFDIDDNPSDNTATAIYVEAGESLVTTNNLLWGSTLTILIVGVYVLVMQRKDTQRLQGKIREKPKSTTPVNKQETTQLDTEVGDDISIEEIQEEEIEEEPVSLIEEIPELETDLSPSGRLDSIRQELDPDDEIVDTTSIEERMSKFFD